MYQFCSVFRQKRNHSANMFSICLFRRERNGTIAYHSTFPITLVVPFFGTGSTEVFPSERNPSFFHFWNNTEWSGTTALQCERDLKVMKFLKTIEITEGLLVLQRRQGSNTSITDVPLCKESQGF